MFDFAKFRAWKMIVNELVQSEIGAGIRDLPDSIPLRDMFEDGLTPNEVKEYIVEMVETEFDTEFGFEEF